MIGKTIIIRGELSGDHDVLIDGRFEGKVSLSKGFAVGRNGVIEADVSAQSVSVGGQFKGNIVAGQRVEIEATAQVTGNITAPRLSIADGAYFRGAVDMDSPRKPGQQNGG